MPYVVQQQTPALPAPPLALGQQQTAGTSAVQNINPLQPHQVAEDLPQAPAVFNQLPVGQQQPLPAVFNPHVPYVGQQQTPAQPPQPAPAVLNAPPPADSQQQQQPSSAVFIPQMPQQQTPAQPPYAVLNMPLAADSQQQTPAPGLNPQVPLWTRTVTTSTCSAKCTSTSTANISTTLRKSTSASSTRKFGHF